MVRVYGPAMSLDASGTLAETITDNVSSQPTQKRAPRSE